MVYNGYTSPQIGDASAAELQQTAALDQLIDRLLESRNQQELAQAVGENIMSFDQKFWLRLATRNDAAESREQKARLSTLASTVMTMVEAVMKNTESQLSSSATVLQQILAAAADERGEWHLPLATEKVDGMRQVMQQKSDQLDEALLSNAFAWMRKAADDKLDGMVALLQKVLQVYAAMALSRQGSQGSNAVLDELLAADEQDWEQLMQQKMAAGDVSEVSLVTAVQKRMEETVLNLQSGSYAQRVQAEYLKELEDRIKSAVASGS